MLTTRDIKCDDIQKSKNLAEKRDIKDCLLYVDFKSGAIVE
jgi:hypothetical protein